MIANALLFLANISFHSVWNAILALAFYIFALNFLTFLVKIVTVDYISGRAEKKEIISSIEIFCFQVFQGALIKRKVFFLNKKDICIRCNTGGTIFVSINIYHISDCSCLSRPTMIDRAFFLSVCLTGVFLGRCLVLFIWGSSTLSVVVHVFSIFLIVNTLKSFFIPGGSSQISSFTLETSSSKIFIIIISNNSVIK